MSSVWSFICESPHFVKVIINAIFVTAAVRSLIPIREKIQQNLRAKTVQSASTSWLSSHLHCNLQAKFHHTDFCCCVSPLLISSIMVERILEESPSDANSGKHQFYIYYYYHSNATYISAKSHQFFLLPCYCSKCQAKASILFSKPLAKRWICVELSMQTQQSSPCGRLVGFGSVSKHTQTRSVTYDTTFYESIESPYDCRLICRYIISYADD